MQGSGLIKSFDDGFIFGIENRITGVIHRIAVVEYFFQAELLRDAMDAHIEPGDYYTWAAKLPGDMPKLMKGETERYVR